MLPYRGDGVNSPFTPTNHLGTVKYVSDEGTLCLLHPTNTTAWCSHTAHTTVPGVHTIPHHRHLRTWHRSPKYGDPFDASTCSKPAANQQQSITAAKGKTPPQWERRRRGRPHTRANKTQPQEQQPRPVDDQAPTTPKKSKTKKSQHKKNNKIIQNNTKKK